MNLLLDLRLSSNRPIHYNELKELIIFTAEECLEKIREIDLQNNSIGDDEENTTLELNNEVDEKVLEENLPNLVKDVDKLLFRYTNTLKSDNKIWEILSIYHQILSNRDIGQEVVKFKERVMGKMEKLLQFRSQKLLCDIRLKQLRNLVQSSNWEKNMNQVLYYS